MVYPPGEGNDNIANNSVNVNIEKRIDKKWWYLAGVWQGSKTGMDMWSLKDDCEDWSSDITNRKSGARCVYGAISTLIIVAGAGWACYQYASEIYNRLANFWYKRSQLNINDEYALTTLAEYQRALVNHTGIAMSPVIGEDGEIILDEIYSVPVVYSQGINGSQSALLFSIDDSQNRTVDIVHTSLDTFIGHNYKREYFNEQDFTKGGIEASFLYGQQNDGGWLDTKNDYQQVWDEVECLFGALNNNALSFQIYDENHQGTIAGGNMRAFSDYAYDTDWLKQINGGLTLNEACMIA